MYEFSSVAVCPVSLYLSDICPTPRTTPSDVFVYSFCVWFVVSLSLSLCIFCFVSSLLIGFCVQNLAEQYNNWAYKTIEMSRCVLYICFCSSSSSCSSCCSCCCCCCLFLFLIPIHAFHKQRMSAGRRIHWPPMMQVKHMFHSLN